jgi:hypothetical protein
VFEAVNRTTRVRGTANPGNLALRTSSGCSPGNSAHRRDGIFALIVRLGGEPRDGKRKCRLPAVSCRHAPAMFVVSETAEAAIRGGQSTRLSADKGWPT